MANRYFVDTLPEPGPFQLAGTIAHHLGTVLRVRAGTEVCLADGCGRSAIATVKNVSRRDVEVLVGPAIFTPRARRTVHLAFAPPRHHRADWLFEHGTEVGTAVFWPLWTERTRPQGERLDRWRKIVLAAAGQCDRDWLPEVRPALELHEFLRCPDLPAQRLVATAGAAPLASRLPADPACDVVLLVGPEGGFRDDEQAAAVAGGFAPCGLGPHILRTETAALVGAALLMAL